ncbi:Coenzyme F420 hydrogenase/dehydrogenase, beta subunit C-terminal domain [Bariatricus sp. HCP3S3_E12]|uniref:Coenzyme F420 hydrogenase/dehydrogenase, beta subunit C-terminal domain n=1 Tax=Bariatricus sp. HCP3S3_E12 TaxID=3438906 RepID=UPI003F8AB630
MDREIPILYSEKNDCCACGACLNICSKQAISMVEDECGFRYPQIDENLCVRCGRCKQVCVFQNSKVENSPVKVFAGVAKDERIRRTSASGGIFAAIAKTVLEEGYVVFGAALQTDYSVRHIAIKSVEDLLKLQGSKYTQSDIGRTYSEVKKYLDQGGKVLFSGTPCQVDGLYVYLGKGNENLVTIDIICHGVPSNRMFKDYIESLGQDVSNFVFRDKSIGWGINGSAIINGKKKRIWQSSSAYLYYFTKGWIYRENCYQCQYTSSHRPADITLGDFWGIEKQHPEYLGKDGWDESKGLSVIIANTVKGEVLLNDMRFVLDLKESTFEKAAACNGQLRHPSKTGKRAELVELYASVGWDGLERRFKKNIGWHFYSSQIKSLIPGCVKRKIKSMKTGE